LYDRMFRPMKMLGGMLVLGGIAASDVAARKAHPQMDPRVSHLQTFLAAICAWLHFLDLFDVRTSFQHGHCALLGFEFSFTTPGDSAAPFGLSGPPPESRIC
jgi:hypothetical protein